MPQRRRWGPRWFDEELLAAFARRARERWHDFTIDRIVQKQRKQFIYIRVQGVNVKLIVYSDGRVRAYTGSSSGLALAVKKLAERVLGVEHRSGKDERAA